MNTRFLPHLATIDIGTTTLDPEKLEQMPKLPALLFDSFYAFAIGMLDEFYPECTITVTSRDPSYAGDKSEIAEKEQTDARWTS